MVNKLESQAKGHFFDLNSLISIIGFLATYKLACDTNNMHEEAAIWVQPSFYKTAFATTLNSRMSGLDYITPAFVLITTTELLIPKKLLQ